MKKKEIIKMENLMAIRNGGMKMVNWKKSENAKMKVRSVIGKSGMKMAN